MPADGVCISDKDSFFFAQTAEFLATFAPTGTGLQNLSFTRSLRYNENERMKFKLPARRSPFAQHLLEERGKNISEHNNFFALAGPSEGNFTVSTH